MTARDGAHPNLPVSGDALAAFGASAVAPGRLLFASISGSHLYGFPSADSDIDLRGTEVKIALYAFRVLMTGIYALRTGLVEANIVKLNRTFRFGFIDELVAMKLARENSPLRAGGHAVDWYIDKAEELRATLVAEAAASSLPDRPDDAAVAELDDLLCGLRLCAAEPNGR